MCNETQTGQIVRSTSRRLMSLFISASLAMLLFGLLVWPGLAFDASNRFRLSTIFSNVAANPDIAAGGNYIATTWSEGYNRDPGTKDWGRVYLKSADVIGGWEARIQVFNATSNVWGKDPSLAVHPSNPAEVHVVWAQADDCGGSGSNCSWSLVKHVTCTLTDADTCGTPETVASTQSYASTPSVAVDASGNVHVVWRTGVVAEGPGQIKYGAKMAGGSWGGPVQIAYGQHPDMVYLGGRLHLVLDGGTYIEYEQDGSPGNSSWTGAAGVKWYAPSLQYQDPSFPAIGAGDSNALYVVWAIQGDGAPGPLTDQYALAFDFSDDNGATWQDAGLDGLGIPDKAGFTPLYSAGGVSYLDSLKPDVAVTGSGDAAYAHVVWHSQEFGSEDRYEVRYTYLPGFAATGWLSPTANVSNDSMVDSGSPAIAIGLSLSQTQMVTHVVFMEDARAAAPDIWYIGNNNKRDYDADTREGWIFFPLIMKRH